MPTPMDLESLWGSLLSRKPDLILTAFERLSPAEQRSILAHLDRMASEPGWHPKQRASALAALKVLKQHST